MKIGHIINPVAVDSASELGIAQKITLETMKLAKRFTRKVNKNISVELFCVGYPEDAPAMPEGFTKLPDLNRSILDIKEFQTPRELPLFKDMLDRLYQCTLDVDYLIQTNIDISLMPHFYLTVASLIEKGYDSLIINKRIIPRFYSKIEEIPEMYAELGTDHNGYDCFVFRRDLYPKFELGDICMGTPWSETTLTANMVAYSKNTTVIKRPHLTFHIGDSRTWMQLHDYREHNTGEFAKILLELSLDKPEILKNDILQWLIYKMKHELMPHYSEACHTLCNLTTSLR